VIYSACCGAAQIALFRWQIGWQRKETVGDGKQTALLFNGSGASVLRFIRPVTRKMPVESLALAPRKATARSRVSNGRDVLPDVDGRSVVARRYRDILAALASDQGGADHMSEARVQLCRRFAALAVQAEQMEAALARGEPIDLQQHALLASTLVRLASRIGVDRVPHDVTPTLSEYLARYEREPDEAAAGEADAEEAVKAADTTWDSPNGNGRTSGLPSGSQAHPTGELRGEEEASA
jgi:hypothetical protein